VTVVVKKTPRAFDDLDEIAAHIGMDNPPAALRFLDHLHEKFLLLAQLPGVGRQRPELDTAIRGFPVDAYVVFYRSIADGVEIVRVLHAGRDIDFDFLGSRAFSQ
jgi:toxin ParE1/3/4